jgi:NAD(P)-dependent dehydrogenase (short-subunit alcohol dehydrogenase family)
MATSIQPRPQFRRFLGLRRLWVAPVCATPVDLRGWQIVVTGCGADSIGEATAHKLAAWGATVVVTTRAAATSAAAVAAITGRLPKDCPGRVLGHALDLCDPASVAGFAEWYRATQGERLDVLVNNGGIHLDLRSQWHAPQLTTDGHEIHWRTNYLGTMHLTHCLLPLLRATAGRQGEARIVNVVSMLHARGRNAALFGGSSALQPYNSWVAYGTSKLALVHATRELQRRYAADGVQAYCLHPGAVLTRIADKGLAGQTLLAAVRRAFAPVEAFFLLTPDEGAQTQIHCATRPGLVGGLYYRDCQPTQASTESGDATVASQLWDETQAWLGRIEHDVNP